MTCCCPCIAVTPCYLEILIFCPRLCGPGCAHCMAWSAPLSLHHSYIRRPCCVAIVFSGVLSSNRSGRCRPIPPPAFTILCQRSPCSGIFTGKLHWCLSLLLLTSHVCSFMGSCNSVSPAAANACFLNSKAWKLQWESLESMLPACLSHLRCCTR